MVKAPETTGTTPEILAGGLALGESPKMDLGWPWPLTQAKSWTQ